ncbi:Arginine decarboxylase [Lachnospiraceae bacterium TWA4]|nr:Arginine decarboxylase [Lachnospiraceae bacterium TWA4]
MTYKLFDLEDNSKGIYKKLIDYSASDYYPFHMPGHKRCGMEFVNPYEIDITEIDGFDDLHHPDSEGLLFKAQEEARNIYHSKASFYLVNGSTSGILSAICASVDKGEKILIAKNCHRSAYHGVYLREIETTYLLPEWLDEWECFGSVNPKEVKKALDKDQSIKAVVIVSPTYEGIVSDILEISTICHKYGVCLIVDEAHGAHFNFSKEGPISALNLGADLVIQSLHKTLPSFTQTAILHVGSDLIDLAKVQFYLDIFQTSSPSYLLMAGIQECIRYMDKEGRNKLEIYYKNLKKLREQIVKLQNFELLFYPSKEFYDCSKIVLKCKGNARELYNDLLNRYHLQPEMSTDNHIILMTTLNDTDEGFNRLIHALQELNNKPYLKPKK